MPHRLEFDSHRRILLISHEGEVYCREIEQLSYALRSRLGELKPSVTISDFSTATRVHFSPPEIRHLAKIDASFPPTMRRFIIAPRDYMFGLARMYELSADPPFVGLQVVRSRQQVLSALGEQNLKFEQLVLAQSAGS